MKEKKREMPGSTSAEISARERKGQALARKAAASGMVLLKNDGILPLGTEKKVALFGVGAAHTVKGGTGSGDVNERKAVTIREGMEDAGYTITSSGWLSDYEEDYNRAVNDYLTRAGKILEEKDQTGELEAMTKILGEPLILPKGRAITKEDLAGADASVYVLSRVAGEGADLSDAPGEYQLSEEEEAQILFLSQSSCPLILVLNTGSPVDLSILEQAPVNALLFIAEPGMEGGNAFADVIRGAVNPSGKLTDTWAEHYADYPNAGTFSHNNGDVRHEVYQEGIYVGYRYFDSFKVTPAFPFGFGLSYTTFSEHDFAVSLDYSDPENGSVHVQAAVTNTGTVSGKETLEVYVSCPQGKLVKEAKRLAGFAKTGELQPGETEILTVTFPFEQMASYSEEDAAYLLEKGDYVVAAGDSSDALMPAAVLRLAVTVPLVSVKNLCSPKEEIDEICPDHVPEMRRENAPVITLDPAKIACRIVSYEQKESEEKGKARQLVNQMTTGQLIAFATGEPSADGGVFGAAGDLVPGSAGQTSSAGKDLGIAEMVVADGPAGLRLRRTYQVRAGKTVPASPVASLSNLLSRLVPESAPDEKTTVYYQYCTAFPVGTLLAQTFDVGLVEEVGRQVAEEMEEFGISLWLAPGMNIHRNPLCGRNFEYYSEDPLLSGTMAAAMTRGVQSMPGTGTTIKHFACNNQEDNRMCSDSIVSERALREIYLHNFEIAVKNSQPMAVMSSYNFVNGIHSANNKAMLTDILRCEWGFKGMVMTDWTTTSSSVPDCSLPSLCMKAGNDLIMPGFAEDADRLREDLASGALSEDDLRRCVANTVNTILSSNCYEDAVPYGEKKEN